jgi:hypothetical protein
MRKIIIMFALMFAFFVSNAQITADFTWSDPQCSEGTIVFTDASTPNSAISWEWYISGPSTPTGILGSSPTFSHTFPPVSTPTDFDVSLYVFDGIASSNTTKTVTIYPLPDVSISPTDPTICEGGIVTLTASGGVDYEWSTTETGSSISPTVSVPTTYSVTATDGNQCQNVASTDVDLYLIDTTVVADEFCEASVYDFYGADLTAPGTYYHTTNSLVTGCDSVIQLDLAMNLIDTTQTVDEFCEGDTYDFLGTPITSPGVYYHTTNSLVTGCDSVTELTLSMNLIDTTVVADEFCEASVYDFYGTDLTAPGTYYYTTNSLVTGCDSVVQLNLTENPTYLIQETHEMCDGDVYSWHGTDYTDAGIYTANYQTSAGCDSIYQLELTVNLGYEFVTDESICEGESFIWRGNTYDVAGTYTDLYSTNSQCDSVYILNLTVSPLPQQVVVLQNPSNGILQSGNSGQISLSTSVVGTQYWVTMGGALYTSELNGTGSGLNLGTNFPAGSFDVWSRNQNDCELLQGTVNFVENTGTNKIVANVTFGTPASNFPANHVKVVLYKKTTDISNNEVIVFEDEQLLSTNGQAEFNNLQPGDYYLGSFIQYPDNYNAAPHIYYQTSVVHEDAISIPVVTGTVFIANLHHVILDVNNGTNNGGGTVGNEDDKKSLDPLKDMVVILKDMDADEIIGVSVTDINGQYAFENIPDNTNIQLFVTSFAHQNWIPYATLTGSSQTYNINFIVDGNSVYPDGITDIHDIKISNIDFSIYPNPASDILQISSSTEKGIMRIYDINGKLLQTELVFTNSKIDISGLSFGTYVVVLTNENGEAGVQKFVKE